MSSTELRTKLGSHIARIDRVVLAFAAVVAGISILDPTQLYDTMIFTLDSMAFIFPFFVLSVMVAGSTKATGLDHQIATVFSGHAKKMIVVAAIFGGLSPFCSCSVIPLIAGLLQAGVPLAPVMAFWISSPLMDPEMFVLLAAVLGLEFTIVKTVAAIGLGLAAGFVTHTFVQHGAFASPLRAGAMSYCCGSTPSMHDKKILWFFWKDKQRFRSFLGEARISGWFLFKWLVLAFLLESLMVAYIPDEFVARTLGSSSGWWLIPAAATVGVPAYLNGYAAIPMVGGLVDMGMSLPGAMTFMVAGGVSSLPASMAVFALVKRELFAWYILLGFVGSIFVGFGYQLFL